MSKKQSTSKEENVEKLKKKEKKIKKAPRTTILDRVVIVFLVLALLAGISGIGVIGYIVSKTDIKDMEQQMINKEPTTFLDVNEERYSELGEEDRENIKYEQVPQTVIDAFLAIEDSRFYKHNGFDLPRFISSAISNLKSGSFAQGGSTLTMQTIDNFFMKPVEEKMEKEGKRFNSIQKVERKLQEIYMSMSIERKFNKKELMEKYLNQINFGEARGIQRGAQLFFGKNVEDLNLAESAYLAGCINAPSNYNPYNGYDEENKVNYYKAAMKRRDETLSMMLHHGYISEKEYEMAKSTQLAFQIVGRKNKNQDPYHAYNYAVTKEVIELTGKDPATTPMIIHTYLNKDAQQAANDIADGKVVSLETNKNYQIGTTVVEVKTGGVAAIIVGRSDFEEKLYKDRANTVERMPGSSIKPIIDYAYSFDKLGYCTSHVYKDKEMSVDGRVIRNSDGKYYGKVSMERAIAQSLNIPAVQTLKDAVSRNGEKPIIDYMLSLGFDEREMQSFNLLYSIGGTMSTSPTQMAAAYAALANHGVYTQPHYVRKIEFKDGKTPAIEVKPKTNQALSPQAAYLTSEMLYKAIFGKYNGWNLMGRLGYGAYPVYGKTGTSDWAEDGIAKGIPQTAMKDEWMINYTSEYAVATWSGFDQDIADSNNYVTTQLLYENIPGWINKHILDTISKNPERISNPGGISSYGGGFIKTEFLKDAAKNNPMTEQNQTSAMDKLEELYKKYSGYKESDYTPETFAKLKAKLDEIKKMIDKDDATDEEIEQAIKDLEGVVGELAASVSTSGLVDAINHAASLDPNIYTSESYTNLRNAVETAKAVLNKSDVTQQEIDAQIASINEAIAALKNNPPAVDKTNLQNAINKANIVIKSLQDENEKASLQTAINEANAVFNNANATQQEIDAQTNKLTALLQ